MDILDASALLAVIRKEKGWQVVNELMKKSERAGTSTFMHQINFIEFTYKCRQLYNLETFNNILSDLYNPFLGIANYFDNDLALYAGLLKSSYRLSLGDAVGLGYTKIMKGTFWTADKALEVIAKKEGISIELIR